MMTSHWSGVRMYNDSDFRLSCTASGRPDLTYKDFSWYMASDPILCNNGVFEYDFDVAASKTAPFGLAQEWTNSLSFTQLSSECTTVEEYDGNYRCTVGYGSVLYQVETHCEKTKLFFKLSYIPVFNPNVP